MFAAGRLSESWAGDQSALGQFQCLALIKHEWHQDDSAKCTRT